MLNILVVDEGQKMKDGLKTRFIKENYKLNEVEDRETVLEKIKKGIFDMVLMDIYTPAELNGFATCREIRRISDVPVIILTSYFDDKNQILAYETGADDFIAKPVKEDILLAKIKRISERLGINQHSYKFSGFEIEAEGHRVIIDSKEIKFAPKEFEILLYLIENKGMVKSRDEILAHVWGYDSEAFNRVVDNHVKKIRKKLGKYSFYLKTAISVGYKFQI